MISETNKLPGGWKWVKLGDVCKKIDYGFTASADFSIIEPRLLRITDIQNGLVNWRTVPGCKINAAEESGSLLIDGDIVIARTGATTGKSFLIKNPPRAVFASYLIRIQSGSQIVPEYLYAFCQSNNYWEQIEANVRGAAQGGVNATLLSSLSLPLPPLAEQKRIAAILEKCDRLRRTRRYTLQLSNTFLQSVFLEMFGDKHSSYERKTLNEVCLKIFDCKHYTPPYVPKGIPLIRTNDVVPGFFKFGSTVYVSQEEYDNLTDVNKPGQGDIVFAREGSFGVASYINNHCKYAIGQRMMLLRTDKRQINPIYLTHFLNSPPAQENLLQVSMGTTVKRVNVGDVKELPLPLPPLSLQEKFAQIVQKYERLRTQQRESDRQAEHLFQTLLHRAFRGELTPQDLEDEPASVLSEH